MDTACQVLQVKFESCTGKGARDHSHEDPPTRMLGRKKANPLFVVVQVRSSIARPTPAWSKVA